MVTHAMDVLDLLRKYSEGGRLGEVRTGRLDDNREVILFGREYAFEFFLPYCIRMRDWDEDDQDPPLERIACR